MSGLLRGMARTAAVVGTATATRNAVNRHAANKNARAYSQAMNQAYATQTRPVQAAPAPAAAPPQDTVSQLERLGALKQQGILTEEEFEAQKAKILAGS